MVDFALREALILQICAPIGRLTDIGFEAIIHDLFGESSRSCRMMCPSALNRRKSEMHLARGAIGRLGREWDVFEKAAPKLFSFEGKPDEFKLDTSLRLWPAYKAVSEGMNIPLPDGQLREWRL